MIQIKDLHKSYAMDHKSLHALKRIYLEVKVDESVSRKRFLSWGKSIFSNVLGSLNKADRGTYSRDHGFIKNLNEKIVGNYYNKFPSFIFQSFKHINYKSALDNVVRSLYDHSGSRQEDIEKTLENFSGCALLILCYDLCVF